MLKASKRVFILFSVSLILSGCSVDKKMNAVSDATDRMDNSVVQVQTSTDHMDTKTMAHVDQNSTQQTRSSNEIATGLKSLSQNIVASEVPGKIVTMEMLRASKKDSLLKDETHSDIMMDAEGYVCTFEFRLWSPAVAALSKPDDVSFVGLREYLAILTSYMSRIGDSPSVNVFAQDLC
jgi:outer membrane murein-binding lipoprotein Lpp